MSKKTAGRVLMSAAEMDLALARIAAEIVEKLSPRDEFAIIGIRRRGVHLANRLCQTNLPLRHRRSLQKS